MTIGFLLELLLESLPLPFLSFGFHFQFYLPQGTGTDAIGIHYGPRAFLIFLSSKVNWCTSYFGGSVKVHPIALLCRICCCARWSSKLLTVRMRPYNQIGQQPRAILDTDFTPYHYLIWWNTVRRHVTR